MKSNNQSESDFKLQSLNEFNHAMQCAGVYAIQVLNADEDEITIKIYAEEI